MQKTKKLLALCLSFLLLASVCACKKEVPQTETPAPEAAAPAENTAEDTSADEAAVRTVLSAFADTMQKGDIKALAAFVSKDSAQYQKYINYDVNALIGEDNHLGIAINDQLAASFANDIFARCSLTVKTIHINGEKATAVLASKMPDLANLGSNIDTEALLGEYMKEVGPTLESLAGNPEELQKFQDSLFDKFSAWALHKMLDSSNAVEKDVNATLTKTDGDWIITNMDSVF